MSTQQEIKDYHARMAAAGIETERDEHGHYKVPSAEPPAAQPDAGRLRALTDRIRHGMAVSMVSADNGNYGAVMLTIDECQVLLAALASPAQEPTT